MINQNDIKVISEQYKENNSIAFICENTDYSRNLATELSNNYNKILILAPNTSIIEEYISLLTQKGIDINRVDFKTYDEIVNYSLIELNNINTNYIILDDFNNIGGNLWNNIFDFIKKNNPSVNILGLAPTLIKAKGSLEELDLTGEGQLFENAMIRKYGLEQMLSDESLKWDGYVSINYNLSEQLNFLEDSIDKSDLLPYIYDELKKQIILIREKLHAEINYGDIIKKYINSNGKYLIICNDEKDLLKTKEFVDNCISDWAKNKSFVSLFNLEEISQDQIISFNSMNFDGIKIMYAINKYNQNLNLENLDGCFLSLGIRNIDTFKNDIIFALNAAESKIIYDLGNNSECIEKINTELSKNKLNKINSFVSNLEIQKNIENISEQLISRTDEFYIKKKELVELIKKNETPKLSHKFKDGTKLLYWLNPASETHERIIQESLLGDEWSNLIVKTYNLKTINLSFDEKVTEIYNHIISGKPINYVEKFSNGQYYKVFLNFNRNRLLKLSETNSKIKLIVETFNVATEITDEDKKRELAEELRNNGKFKSTANVLFSDGTRMYDWQKRKAIREKHKIEANSGDKDAKLILKTFVKLTFAERVLETVEKIDAGVDITIKSKIEFSDGTVIATWPTTSAGQKLINAALKGDRNCKKIVEYFKLDEKKEKIKLTYEECLIELLNKLKYCYENNKSFSYETKFSNGMKMKNWLEDNRIEIEEDSKNNQICKDILDYEYKIENEFEICKKEFLGYIRVNGIKDIPSSVLFSNGRQMNKWWSYYQHKVFVETDETSKEIIKIYNSVIRLTNEQKIDEIIDKIKNGEKITGKTLLSDGRPVIQYYHVSQSRFKYYALVKEDPKSIILVNYFDDRQRYDDGKLKYLEQFNKEKQEVINLLEENNPNILKEKISSGKTVYEWLRRHRYRLVMEGDPYSIRIAETLVVHNFKDADGEELIMMHKQ